MASSKPRRDRTGDRSDNNDTPSKPFILRCDLCLSPDPEVRTLHQLRLLKNYSLDVLRDHLVAQYVTEREAGKKRQDVVDAIMTWATNLIEQYSGMADPRTGAKMPWWQARQWLMDNRDATAASAYNQAPDKYREHNPPPGNLKPAVQHITMHLPVEPGDDDPLAI